MNILQTIDLELNEGLKNFKLSDKVIKTIIKLDKKAISLDRKYSKKLSEIFKSALIIAKKAAYIEKKFADEEIAKHLAKKEIKKLKVELKNLKTKSIDKIGMPIFNKSGLKIIFKVLSALLIIYTGLTVTGVVIQNRQYQKWLNQITKELLASTNMMSELSRLPQNREDLVGRNWKKYGDKYIEKAQEARRMDTEEKGKSFRNTSAIDSYTQMLRKRQLRDK